jgi:prepilin-type N-terminal cleavage/methylation domain-containing protein
MSNVHRNQSAFTLIELLVVIAIIAILAAILFPVFAQAKVAAKKTKSIAHFKQLGTSTAIYLADYDDCYMLSNSGGIGIPGWGFGPPDTVPGQQLFPYVKNTEMHIDPMDPWQSEKQRIADQIQYMSVGNPNNLTEAERLYALMVRSNAGYNYAFFSPWRYIPSTQYVGSASVNGSQIANPSNTIMFGTSIWDRNGGGPTGGGNWVIETPCWLDSNGNLLQPMAQYQADGTLQSYSSGWANNPNSWLVYGGMWPFYNQVDISNISPGLKDGHVVVVMADTSTKSRPIKSITKGCTAFGTGLFKGRVTDKDAFMWDFE